MWFLDAYGNSALDIICVMGRNVASEVYGCAGGYVSQTSHNDVRLDLIIPRGDSSSKRLNERRSGRKRIANELEGGKMERRRGRRRKRFERVNLRSGRWV